MSISTTSKKVRINQEIRAPQVRLIDPEGNQLGVVNIREALQSAADFDLDLVEIAPNAEPIVCRIMDYGKYQFEQNKRSAQARKHQHRVQVKEIKFRPSTEEGDYQVKLRNLIRFLESGDKVKITVRFRGREVVHQEFGMQLLQRIQQDLEPYGIVEQKPEHEGRQMIMVIAPGKGKKSA